MSAPVDIPGPWEHAHVAANGARFHVATCGEPTGSPVVLLHGFPQFSDCWDGLAPLLHAQGYRTIAMDQRGYSPGARPAGVAAYRMSELVADALALLDHVGGPAHVVGHDWGATVAWSLAMRHPDRVRTLTALSVPHAQALRDSFTRSAQILRLWYVFAIQLQGLPERFLTAQRFAEALIRGGQSPAAARRDAGRLHGEALTGALNWYRAAPRAPRPVPVRVPTLYVWSDRDVAVTRAAADRCGLYVEGPFQYEVLRAVSHWIPDEAPAETAALILAHLRS